MLEELDRGAQVHGQFFGEHPARLEDAILYLGSDLVEAVPRRDQLERQVGKLRAVCLGEGVQAVGFGLFEDPLVSGKIIGVDKAEAVHELMAGRQVAEQFDHQRGGGAADLGEIIAQADLDEDLAHVGVRAQVIDVEFGPHRRSEKNVFGDRGMGVEFLLVERLHEDGKPGHRQPLGDHAARLEHAFDQLRVGGRVDDPAQAELKDVFLETDGGEHLRGALRQTPGAGGAGGLVVDPVGVDVEGVVAGFQGFVAAQFPRRPRRVVIASAVRSRPALEAVKQVVAERA